jgi:uncharacterized protein YutE (UPF0331/DUF86 family)
MVDQDLILKKLAFIETCVQDLKAKANPDSIFSDIREERFVVHTLQLAIQSALDVASHIVSDNRYGEPNTNRELFELLNNNQWLPNTLTESMRNMAGFRNIIVHGYEKLNLDIVKDIVENKLVDLLEFVSCIRSKLN